MLDSNNLKIKTIERELKTLTEMVYTQERYINFLSEYLDVDISLTEFATCTTNDDVLAKIREKKLAKIPTLLDTQKSVVK